MEFFKLLFELTKFSIFNSKSILDGISIENLPIGLFGDFYSHELTFFLIDNNDLKNIKQVFNKNNFYIGLRCQRNYKILIANAWQIADAVYLNKDRAQHLYYIIIW